MDCLQDYIGLEQCNDGTEPDSGLYINTLAGISTEVLQKIANGEQGTYARVWQAIQRVAGLRLYADIIGKLRARYKLKTVRSTLTFIPAVDGAVSAETAKYRGMRLKFDYITHTFQSFVISELLLVADTGGTTAIKIFDKYGGLLYEKADLTAVVGLNRYRVDRSFVEDEIYVAFDFVTATPVDGRQTSFVQDVITGFWNQCQSCGWCMDCEPTIEGFTSDDGLTFTETSRNTHGMGIVGFLGCDYKSIVCNNKELFTTPWLYLLGSQIMINVLSSPRSNQATTVDRKKYEELRDHYQVEYEKLIVTALQGYMIPAEGDCCVECNENPSHQQWLP